MSSELLIFRRHGVRMHPDSEILSELLSLSKATFAKVKDLEKSLDKGRLNFIEQVKYIVIRMYYEVCTCNNVHSK